MKTIKSNPTQAKALKLKAASLTYFTIFSSLFESNHITCAKGLKWSENLETALTVFNAAGTDFRYNPSPENSNKYKHATKDYYNVLLNNYECIPKSVTEDYVF